MLCFDKLKLITSINNIKDIDTNEFDTNSKKGIIRYDTYQQKIPSLLISAKYQHDELVIVFTSKILKDNFIHLINKNNIRECLENINQLNICKLDIDAIISNSLVVICDVAKDIYIQDMDMDMEALKNYTNFNLGNHSKWKQINHRNGFTLHNTCTTLRSKKRMIIYNKEKELERAENELFLNSLSDKDKCLLHFRNKIRIERNLKSAEQIRKELQIPDNQLMSVLNSDANPILAMFNEALKEIPTNIKKYHSITDYKNELVLRDCDFDVSKVEAKMRSLYSKNTQIAAVMKPFRELHQRLQQNDNTPLFDIRNLVVSVKE